MNATSIKKRNVSMLLLAFLAALLMGSCFGGAQEQPVDEVIRTPRPTFTPTPVQPTATASPVPTQPTATPAPGDPVQVDAGAPLVVVNSDQVNARKLPSITSDNIIRELGRGTELHIIGKSADDEWWYVCCVDGATAWVYYSYVDTSGALDSVPVTDAAGGMPGVAPAQEAAAPSAAQPAAEQPAASAPPSEAPPPAPAATNTPVPAAPLPAAEEPGAPTVPAEVAQPLPPTDTPAPTEPPAPEFPFNLVAQEQFVETNNLVRIFAYVYQGDTPLPGYTLRVARDGGELPVSATSADQAGMTWPVADPRQRFQNMKVEFPNVQPAGTWTVQLIDGSGAPAGPAATFTLVANEQNRELYVRYEKP
jgi:hypothetical protein